jgi:MFS family permease
VLLAGGFLPPVDFFIVNVSLPSIREDLGASPAAVQLVVSGYAASYAVFLITGGRLGDLYGRRRLFLLGMVGFILANLLCGIAATPLVLVLGRMLLGLSAAVLVPQVLASIRALYEEERALARALGFYGVMMGLAAATGQFAGGALVQWSPWGMGWRAVFLLKLPVALVLLGIAWLAVPETSDARRVKLDLAGAALISLALAGTVVPLSKGRDQGWPAWVFMMLALVPVLAAWFLWHEERLAARGGMPLVDLGLMAIPSFRRGVLVGTLFFFTTSFYLLFSLYEQEGRGTDPLQTGLAILPYGIGLFAGPLASAPLVALRPKLLALGMAVQVSGYAAVGVFVALGLPGWAVALAVLVAGFGQGVAFPRLYNTVLGEVPAAQAGLASGIVNSALQVGAAVSVAAIGSLFFSLLDPAGGERSYAYAFAAAQGTLTLALFAAMLIAIPPRREGVARRVRQAPE